MHQLVLSFLLCVAPLGNIRASLFVDDVSLATAHPGDDVTVKWALTEPASMGDIHRISIPDVLSCLNHHIMPGSPSYEPITCEEPNLVVVPLEARENSSVDVEMLGFTIQNVTLDDAKAYQMTVFHSARKDPQISSTGVIYVFQQPTAPQISLSVSSVHGRNKTVVCSSESRSLPPEYRYMVRLVYEWSLDILQSDPDGDPTDSVRTSKAVDSTAIVSCTAHEQGSKFVSDAATFDPTIPTGNKPAIILGVVLLIFGIALFSLVGYMWCSGKMNEQLPATSNRSSAPSSAPEGTTAVDDTAQAEGGQYAALTVRETTPGDEQTYDRIQTNAGRRGITESQLYENVRM